MSFFDDDLDGDTRIHLAVRGFIAASILLIAAFGFVAWLVTS